MKVPFVDLPSQFQALRSELEAALAPIYETCDFTLGGAVGRFETSFAAYLGAQHCVGVANGTDAIQLALRALDIGPGDEVITTANTFVATVTAIYQSGARTVLVDCDPISYNIDIEQLRAAITPRTRAIVPVHLYGQPADMDAVLGVARDHGLRVVEDAAQAHGAYHGDQAAGTLGDLGCFSFYPGKNLGGSGDGGAVITNDGTLAEKLRSLRIYGVGEPFQYALKGINSRLDTVQAAVLGVKLPYLDDWNRKRFAHAATYADRLAGLVKTPGIVNRATEGRLPHVFHLYVICANDRDRVAAELAERGVATGKHYPVPIHMQPAYQDLGYAQGAFPAVESYAAELLSLPMAAELSDDQVRYVCDSLAAII